MRPFSRIAGTAIAMLDANIDTDQILPKQFLRTVQREGLGSALFYDLRFNTDGTIKPENVFNRQSASILIAGENFGCGSSREHAAWALEDYGIRCVIAPSFAEIFTQNCANNGILLVSLPERVVQSLADMADAESEFQVDLVEQIIVSPTGRTFPLEIDPGKRDKLLRGLDEIGETLAQSAAIDAFERNQRLGTPWNYA